MNSDKLQRVTSTTMSSSKENDMSADTSSENNTSTLALIHSVSKDNINSGSRAETLDHNGGFCNKNGHALGKSEKVGLVENSRCFQSIPVKTCFTENKASRALDGSGVRREEDDEREVSHIQQHDSSTVNEKNTFPTTFAAVNSNVDVYMHSREKETKESPDLAVCKDDNEEKNLVSALPPRNERNTLSVNEISILSADLGKIQFTTKQEVDTARRAHEFQGVSLSSIHGNLGPPAAKCGPENNRQSFETTKTKPRIVISLKSETKIEENEEAGDTRSTGENENTAGSANPLVVRKLKSKVVEEKFKEYEKENKTKQTAARKKLKFMVSNAEKAIIEARMKIAAKRLGDASRKPRDFRLRVRTTRNRSMDGSVSPAYSNNSCSSMSNRSKTPNENKIEDIDLAKKLQADLDREKEKRWNTINRRPEKANQSFQQLNCKSSSPALTEKSASDGSFSLKRTTSKGLKSTRFERYEVEWLVLELRNLNLYDQALDLSLALRKKEETELLLRLELRRERKKAKEMARQAKKAELERERREEKRRKLLENERRTKERLERMELERQRQLEEDRKRREHDKILLENFSKSLCATSISRSNTFSYFPLLANKPVEKPKEQRRLSAVRSRQCTIITSKYRQFRSRTDSYLSSPDKWPQGK